MPTISVVANIIPAIEILNAVPYSPPANAQYVEFSSMVEITSPLIYDNGSRKFRKRIEDDYLYYDIELTDTGFDGVENTDWEWLARYMTEWGYIYGRYRHGVEGNYFKVQSTFYVPIPPGEPGWEDLFRYNHSGAATLFRDGINGDNRYVVEEWTGTEWLNLITL